MKCRISQVTECTHTLHFNRDLPVLKTGVSPPWRNEFQLALRPRNRAELARRLAFLNREHRPFEIVWPTRTYASFLSDLIVIEGLVEIQNADRYSVTLVIGAMFDPQKVAARFVDCVRDHFYPDEQIEFARDVSCRLPTEDGQILCLE